MVRLWGRSTRHPPWWGELKAVFGMADLHRFAQKIQVSFRVPEIRYWVSPSQGYSAPPAPKSLNWGAFISGRLEYQDVWQRPILLTETYCWSLQHWAEKVYPPISLDAHPLAESIKELCLAMSESVTITKRDILEGLKMERPTDSHWPPSVTLFSWVLGPQLRDEKQHQPPLGFPEKMGCQDHGAEPAHSFMWPQVGHLLACQELLQYQHFHPPKHWWQCNLLPHPKVLLTPWLTQECQSPHD